jgi:dynactin complex subunit
MFSSILKRIEIAKELETAMDRTNKLAGEVRARLKGENSAHNGNWKLYYLNARNLVNKIWTPTTRHFVKRVPLAMSTFVLVK